MGQDAKVYIFFGLYLGNGQWPDDPDYTPLPEWTDYWEDYIAELAGFQRPSVAFNAETQHIYEKYWAQKREAVAKCPLELVTTAGGEEFSLAVKASLTSLTWSKNPLHLEKEPIGSNVGLEQLAEWRRVIESWLPELDIPAKRLQAGNPRGPHWICLVGHD